MTEEAEQGAATKQKAKKRRARTDESDETGTLRRSRTRFSGERGTEEAEQGVATEQTSQRVQRGRQQGPEQARRKKQSIKGEEKRKDWQQQTNNRRATF